MKIQLKTQALPNYCYLIRGAKLKNVQTTIANFGQINPDIAVPPTHILLVSPNKKIQPIAEKINNLNFEGEIILLDNFWLQFHQEASYHQYPFNYLTIGTHPNKKSYKVLANLDLLTKIDYTNCYFWLI
jgi:hypothetical protein